MKRWIAGVLANSGNLAWWFLVFNGSALMIIGVVMVVMGLTIGAGLQPVAWLAVGLAALMIALGLWLKNARSDPNA
jgi:hypothetical protein